MTVRQKEIWAGVLFLLFGMATIWIGRGYGLWVGTQVGSGLFPVGIGLVIGLLGIAQIIVGARLQDAGHADAWLLRPILFILLSIVAFALMVERLGLLPALAVAGTVASFAARPNAKHLVIILMITSTFAYFFLKLFLGMPFKMLIV